MRSIVSALRVRGARRAVVIRSVAALLVLAMVAAPAPKSAGAGLTLLTSVTLGYRAHDLILDGNFAYVATENGLTILDVSNLSNPPHTPQVRASVPATNRNRSQGLAKKGRYVFLAAGKAGMQVIDVNNPDDPHDPRTVANAWAGGNIFDVAVHPTANAAYAISYAGELWVWDIDGLYAPNPTPPVLKQRLGVLHWRGVCDICVERMRNLTPSGGAQSVGVSAAGNVVSAVDYNYGGYYAWDSTDPLHLTFIATARVPVSFRSEVDIERDDGHGGKGVVYVLGTYSKGSGVHTVPLSVLRHAPNGVIYPPYLRPAGAPTDEWCVGPLDGAAPPRCGFVPSAVPMDGGGIGFVGKYVF